jgi:hypothetical protein
MFGCIILPLGKKIMTPSQSHQKKQRVDHINVFATCIWVLPLVHVVTKHTSFSTFTRPFNFLNLGRPCNFPEVYFGLFSAVPITFLPLDCRPKSGHFAF